MHLTTQQRDALIDAIADDWLLCLQADPRLFDDWFREIVIEGKTPLSAYEDDDLLQAADDAELPIIKELGLEP